jgi:hypothetical protein
MLMLSKAPNKNMFLFYPKRQGAFANNNFGTTVGHCTSIAGHSTLTTYLFIPAVIPVPGSSHGGFGGGSQLPVGFGGGQWV